MGSRAVACAAGIALLCIVSGAAEPLVLERTSHTADEPISVHQESPHARNLESVSPLLVQLEQWGYHWTVDLLIGSVPASVRVVADTGSSDLAVLRADYDAAASSTSVVLPGASTSHNLVVDKLHVIFHDIKDVIDTVSFASASDGSAAPPQIRGTVLTSARMSVNDYPPRIQQLQNVSGFFGMSYGYMAVGPNSTFAGLVYKWFTSNPSAPRVLGFDFVRGLDTSGEGGRSVAAHGNSTLQIGGLLPGYEQSMVWSEVAALSPPLSYTRPIFNMAMCGVSVFANYSSNWPALVDTGAVCLSLPREFYDAVMAWLPARCDGLAKINGRCLVGTSPEHASTLDTKKLPHLTFQLAETGGLVAIPIGELIVGSGSERTYCILPSSGSVSTTRVSMDTSRSRIVFGSLVVASMYTAVNLESGRMGFASKPHLLFGETTAGSRELCSVQATCVGAQVYYAPTNECTEPRCRAYFFQEVDEATQLCRVAPVWRTLGIVAVTVFALAELGIYIAQVKVSRTAMRVTGRAPAVPPISLISQFAPARRLQAARQRRSGHRQRLDST